MTEFKRGVQGTVCLQFVAHLLLFLTWIAEEQNRDGVFERDGFTKCK